MANAHYGVNMVIYDLICPQNHTFEGWFNNPQSFDDQLAADMVQCPHCGLSQVSKKPSGGHMASPRSRAKEASATPSAQPNPPISVDPVLMLKQIQSHIQKHFKNVGENFCETAIAMHEGKSKPENIVGSLTPEQKEILDDKGVNYMGVPKLGPEFEN